MELLIMGFSFSTPSHSAPPGYVQLSHTVLVCFHYRTPSDLREKPENYGWSVIKGIQKNESSKASQSRTKYFLTISSAKHSASVIIS